MTNAINRLAMLKDPANVVDVFSAADLPPAITAPDGVTRTPLASATKYVVHESFTWPRLLLPTFSGSGLADFITIEGVSSNIFMFMDGDTTPQIWGRDNVSLVLQRVIFLDTSNAGTGGGTSLFDLVGSLDIVALFTMSSVGLFFFGEVGDVIDMPSVLDRQGIGTNLKGLTFRSTPFRSSTVAHSFSQVQFQNRLVNQIKPTLILQGPAQAFSSIGGSIDALPGDSTYMIDQSSDATHDIGTISYGGAADGNFFRPDVSQSLSAMADVSTSITGFASVALAATVIAAAPAAAGGTLFVTSAAHGFQRGDTVAHSGFSNGAYNGTFAVTTVVSSGTYIVSAIAFISTDSGSAVVSLVQVDAASHGRTRGQTIRIANTANYDGLQLIRSVAADEDSFLIDDTFVITETGDIATTRVTTSANNPIVKGETISITGTTSYNITDEETLEATSTTFDIPVLFAADDATGTVTSSSKNETTVGLCVSNAGFQADSKSIGSMHVNGNSTATTISLINTWTDANLAAGAVASSNIQRWSLTNTTTGELRYDGDQPFSGVALVSLSGEGEPGNDDYEFRIVVNGSPTGDNIVASTSTNNALRNVGLVVPLMLVSGDLIRIQIQNTTGTDDFTFAEVSTNAQ